MSQPDNLPQAEGESNGIPSQEEPQKEAQSATPHSVPDESKNPDKESDDSQTASEGLKATEKPPTPPEKKEPEIPFKDYDTLSLEVLVGEGESLLKSHPAHKLKSHFSKIRKAFNLKMDALEAKAKQSCD